MHVVPSCNIVPLKELTMRNEENGALRTSMLFPNRAVDILGMVERIWPPEDFTSKAGRDMRRQRVQLFDQTASGFAVTLYVADHACRTEYPQLQ